MQDIQPSPTQSPTKTTHALPPPNNYTVEQAMAFLNYSRTKVNALLGSKAIKSYRDGKRRYIPVAELHAYVNRMLQAEAA
jgi:excisionase family DNA binding protein